MQTNLIGAFNGSAIAQAGMSSQSGGGWIWNMEGFGSRGEHQPGMATYGASKRAVQYLTEALIRDAKGSTVKVGFLSPGIVATDLLVGDYEGHPEEFEKVKKIFNILGDRVETVTPWLVEQVLDADKHGSRVAWLTKPKAMGRFMSAGFRKRDILHPRRPDERLNHTSARQQHQRLRGVRRSAGDRGLRPRRPGQRCPDHHGPGRRSARAQRLPGRADRRHRRRAGWPRQGDLEAVGRHRLLGVPDPRTDALPVPGLRVQCSGLGSALGQARQRAAGLAVRRLPGGSRDRRPVDG
ncbi:SDR family NAD(P)-dependent oxidoreductase [Aeromicrobium sp. UC242_57]|uniref:SDR family NAD(P)-dependent oxidoreductase n=1 Tax=Aeromicrobium sp. UC242_57 TaxID=3374624 RepID=UPI0037943136